MADRTYDVSNAKSLVRNSTFNFRTIPKGIIICSINVFYALVSGIFWVKTKGLLMVLLRDKIDQTFKKKEKILRVKLPQH